MALGDARPGAVDWLAAAVGPSMLVVEDVPVGWVSLTAVVVSSLEADGVLVETCGVSQSGTTVTVSLSGVQIAALGDVVYGWRLLSSGVPVLAGRWKAEPVPSAAWQSVSVVVGGGVRVVVSGASGSVGVTDHGALSGLGDDDHTQYLTSGRHGAISGNPHGTTAGEVGADPSGTAAGLVGAEAAIRSTADLLRALKAGDTFTGNIVVATPADTSRVRLEGQPGQGATFTAWSDGTTGLVLGRAGGTTDWQVYRTGGVASPFYFRDLTNARNQITLTAGASPNSAHSGFDSRATIGGATDLGAALGVQSTTGGRVALRVKSAAAQTFNLIEAQDSAAANVFSVSPTGFTTIAAAYGADALRIGTDGYFVRNGQAAGRLILSPDGTPVAGGFSIIAKIPNGLSLVDASNNQVFEVNGVSGNVRIGTIATGGVSAAITLNGSAAGGSNMIQFLQNGTSAWWLGNFSNTNLRLMDVVNGSRDHARWIMGASADLAITDLHSRVNVGTTTDGGAQLYVFIPSASRPGISIQMASIATGDPLRVRSSAPADLWKIRPSGREWHTAANTATTVGASGAASALPALPLGYLLMEIDGASVKVPYYTA